MTLLEAALAVALAALIAYRAGWAFGARRMARALNGEPAGGIMARLERRRRRKVATRATKTLLGTTGAQAGRYAAAAAAAGISEGDFAKHLEECDDCREAAKGLLDGPAAADPRKPPTAGGYL